jgi:signal transduction histidine kinase
MDFARVQSAQDEERAALAFSTVHNLRQPTMAIRGALQRILKRKEKGSLTTEYAVEATKDALRYLERSEHIICNVMRYIKPLMLRTQTVHLRRFLQPVVDEFVAAHSNVKVEIAVPQAVTLCADPESLTQIFEEMFGNAAQAMQDRGTVRVSVSDQLFHDKETPSLRIMIEDNGPGIPPKFVEQLFQPFKTGSVRGTGLGLAFIKHVMEEHRGQIWHERVDPHGARFVLVFPSESKENSHDE